MTVQGFTEKKWSGVSEVQIYRNMGGGGCKRHTCGIEFEVITPARVLVPSVSSWNACVDGVVELIRLPLACHAVGGCPRTEGLAERAFVGTSDDTEDTLPYDPAAGIGFWLIRPAESSTILTGISDSRYDGGMDAFAIGRA